jgi:L-methionine (R)-S-oxide reductase
VWDKAGALLAVLDIDSDQPNAFFQTDGDSLAEILALVFSR